MAEIAEDKAIAQSDIEIWFADEARIGQKNKITRRWRLAHRPAKRCALASCNRSNEFSAYERI